ncbi:nitric oxide reductase activation protein NorD [Hoeflea sp.]|uniref:nitric oxide reductase activation protein NorD n=1 Tax=Hoeflea sp. TaxID=1940281 RepID=UPI00374A8397
MSAAQTRIRKAQVSADAMCAQSFRSSISSPLHDQHEIWAQACERLRSAGYAPRVARAYQKASVEIADRSGSAAAIKMADTVSMAAIKSGSSAAEAVCANAVLVSRRYTEPCAFDRWLVLVDLLISRAATSLAIALKQMDLLTQRLTIEGLEVWVWSGIRSSGSDRARQLAYFKLEAPEAIRGLAQAAGEAGFADFSTGMEAYLAGLYGLRLKLRENVPANVDPADYRATFSHGVVNLPAAMPGLGRSELKALYRASLAHVGAHLAYSPGKITKGRLRPIQIAVVSVIEDARVEHLAMRDMPGLRRLWQPFHAAKPSAMQTAPHMLASLTHALFAPDFIPDTGQENSWVGKASRLFFDARDEWQDPDLSRRLGNGLGNDLGQMRVQLNAKNYIVQPAYRDDNLGIWDFPDPPLANNPETVELQTEAIKIRKQSNGSSRNNNSQAGEPDERQTAKPIEPDLSQETGRLIGRFPEFDVQINRERADWVTVNRYEAVSGSEAFWERILSEKSQLISRLTSLIRSSAFGETRNRKRQPDGESLDIDACIAALSQLKMGQMPDPGLYEKRGNPARELAVSILLDISQSTGDRVGETSATLLELETEAVAVLAAALDEIGDRFAINAFCSVGRDDVRYHPIKSFDEPASEKMGRALSALSPGYSTRMGAALRCAGSELMKVKARRRLVLLLSDGEPSDIDCDDPDYLLQDARRAVRSLAARGIDVFCVGLGGTTVEHQSSIFGRNGFANITTVQDLPAKLATLYLKLSR